MAWEPTSRNLRLPQPKLPGLSAKLGHARRACSPLAQLAAPRRDVLRDRLDPRPGTSVPLRWGEGCVTRSLLQASRAVGVRVGHYVVPSNHFHRLALLPDDLTVSRYVQRLKVRTHTSVGEPGTLWEAGFRGLRITGERVRLQKTLYIHENALKYGLAARPEEYRWSSAYALAPGVCGRGFRLGHGRGDEPVRAVERDRFDASGAGCGCLPSYGDLSFRGAPGAWWVVIRRCGVVGSQGIGPTRFQSPGSLASGDQEVAVAAPRA